MGVSLARWHVGMRKPRHDRRRLNSSSCHLARLTPSLSQIVKWPGLWKRRYAKSLIPKGQCCLSCREKARIATQTTTGVTAARRTAGERRGSLTLRLPLSRFESAIGFPDFAQKLGSQVCISRFRYPTTWERDVVDRCLWRNEPITDGSLATDEDDAPGWNQRKLDRQLRQPVLLIGRIPSSYPKSRILPGVRYIESPEERSWVRTLIGRRTSFPQRPKKATLVAAECPVNEDLAMPVYRLLS